MSTLLANRILWFDGTSQVDPSEVPSLILSGIPVDKISVNSSSRDLELYNRMEKPIPIGGPREAPHFDLSWNIPQKYQQLDLGEHIAQILEAKQITGSDYLQRVIDELDYILSHPSVEMLFRSLIYIMDRLRAENKVWGIGRGSSCASLILFLLEVHVVDPVKYNIPMEEFFHD